jgi:hypothetical protein
MATLGALAGVAFYGLSEIIGQAVLPDRLLLAISVFLAVFFFALLALVGPLQLRRVIGFAVALAAAVAGLMSLASLRFENVADLFQTPFPVFAGAVLAIIPLPFYIAASGPGWRDYPVLFTQSWTILVRYAAAGLFTLVVWGVIFFSNLLLSIVGLTVIEWMVEIGPVPWVITGAVLGFSMAVVTELSDLVSPYLVLRLFRLLLPVVLVVMAVFVIALPFQGLSGLMAELSVAATLLAMAGIGVTLVTVAVDQSDDDGVQSMMQERAARALALLVPVFAALAGWAVWLRVDEYGLTPERIFAALAALICAGYGVAYVWAVLGGASWRGRVRAANRSMALVLMATAVAWLSVLNPQAISAGNQVARYAEGRTKLADLDLYTLDDWGYAGAGARAKLEAIAAKDASLANLLAENQAGQRHNGADNSAARRAALALEMPVRPVGADASSVIAAMTEWTLVETLASCRRVLPDGSPGCVLIFGDFWTDQAGNEAILLRDSGSNFPGLDGFAEINGRLEEIRVLDRNRSTPDWPAMIRAALDGTLEFAPVPQNMLRLGGAELVLLP